MTAGSKDVSEKKCSFEDALDIVGFGKYSIAMLLACCLIIMAMYFDIFGFSVIMPAVACDMSLTTSQQGLLSAIPLIGVMLSSYAWGLCADTIGRKKTLLIAMPIGAFFNLAASLAPNYASLAVLKFFSASFTSSANAAGFVLMGETVPRSRRSTFMFLMASATMFTQMCICLCALPIFKLTFHVEISWLSQEYRPWRLLMQVISIPGIIGVLLISFLYESPKFLLSKSRDEEALNVLKTIYSWNKNSKKENFPFSVLYLEDNTVAPLKGVSFIRKMWDQTAPLFKAPLLKNSLMLYYILLCAFMTSTGYTMWVPTMTNAYFNGEDSTGLTFCQVASKAAVSSNSTATDCNSVIATSTLYAVMLYSVTSGILGICLSVIVIFVGKKKTTLVILTLASICGVLLLFVRIAYLSITLFYMFLYVALILGNINTYLVELNPTHLRGMATCLSVVVARGFGFISVQLIAALLANYCTPMITSYIILVISGLVVAVFLPADDNTKIKNKKAQNETTNGHVTQVELEDNNVKIIIP